MSVKSIQSALVSAWSSIFSQRILILNSLVIQVGTLVKQEVIFLHSSSVVLVLLSKEWRPVVWLLLLSSKANVWTRLWIGSTSLVLILMLILLSLLLFLLSHCSQFVFKLSDFSGVAIYLSLFISVWSSDITRLLFSRRMPLSLLHLIQGKSHLSNPLL